MNKLRLLLALGVLVGLVIFGVLLNGSMSATSMTGQVPAAVSEQGNVQAEGVMQKKLMMRGLGMS